MHCSLISLHAQLDYFTKEKFLYGNAELWKTPFTFHWITQEILKCWNLIVNYSNDCLLLEGLIKFFQNQIIVLQIKINFLTAHTKNIIEEVDIYFLISDNFCKNDITLHRIFIKYYVYSNSIL